MSADLIAFLIASALLLCVNISLYRKDAKSLALQESMMKLFSSTSRVRLLKLRMIYGGMLALCILMLFICL